MKNVNLKLLQTFLLAVEHGSFRRAAEDSNRSPSAVSMQIRDLEEQLGVSLFTRTAHKAVLTGEGKVLFDQVSQAMKDIQTGIERLRELSLERRSLIKIACAPTLASTRLGPILATFRLRYPRSMVEVHETSPAAALTLLQQQEVELYVGPELADLRDCAFEPLFDDRFVACAPPQFLSGRQAVSLAELGNTPLILLDRQTAVRTQIDRLAAAGDLALNVQYSVQNVQTAIALASAGLGVAILPTIALSMTANSLLRVMPISDRHATRAIGIIVTRGYVRHAYSEQLMDFIRAELQAAAPEPARQLASIHTALVSR